LTILAFLLYEDLVPLLSFLGGIDYTILGGFFLRRRVPFSTTITDLIRSDLKQIRIRAEGSQIHTGLLDLREGVFSIHDPNG
jgi:hypothetical protein